MAPVVVPGVRRRLDTRTGRLFLVAVTSALVTTGSPTADAGFDADTSTPSAGASPCCSADDENTGAPGDGKQRSTCIAELFDPVTGHCTSGG